PSGCIGLIVPFMAGLLLLLFGNRFRPLRPLRTPLVAPPTVTPALLSGTACGSSSGGGGGCCTSCSGVYGCGAGPLTPARGATLLARSSPSVEPAGASSTEPTESALTETKLVPSKLHLSHAPTCSTDLTLRALPFLKTMSFSAWAEVAAEARTRNSG